MVCKVPNRLCDDKAYTYTPFFAESTPFQCPFRSKIDPSCVSSSIFVAHLQSDFIICATRDDVWRPANHKPAHPKCLCSIYYALLLVILSQ